MREKARGVNDKDRDRERDMSVFRNAQHNFLLAERDVQTRQAKEEQSEKNCSLICLSVSLKSVP